MNTSIVTLQYNDFPVIFQSNAFLNATAIAKQFGKKPEGYLRTNETKEYIAALSKYLFGEDSVAPKSVTEQNQLVTVVQGGNNQGTWLHPKLAVHFARWLNADFAVWCDMQIDKLLKPIQNGLKASPYILGQEAAQLKKSIEAACKTDKKLYAQLYRKLYGAYGIDSYLHLPAGKLNEALVFLGLKPVEMPEMVLIDAKELAALKNQLTKPQYNDYPSIILNIPSLNERILVERHNGVTALMQLPTDHLIGSEENIIRDLKARGYIIAKNEKHALETIAKIANAEFVA